MIIFTQYRGDASGVSVGIAAKRPRDINFYANNARMRLKPGDLLLRNLAH